MTAQFELNPVALEPRPIHRPLAQVPVHLVQGHAQVDDVHVVDEADALLPHLLQLVQRARARRDIGAG